MRLFDDWLLLPQRFALHEPSATAVLADIHLGYSAARQRLGDAVPWRTVADETQPLADAAKMYDLRALIVAGDLFERGFDAALYQDFRAVLDRLHIRFLGLTPGNHDRNLDPAPADLRLFAEGYDLAGWHIVHGDQPVEPARAVMGHWHPAARWNRRKVPCFLAHGQHLILPAFSLDAAGVDVRAESRWHEWDCYAVSGNRVIPAK